MQSGQKSQLPEDPAGVHLEGYELFGRIGRGPRAEVWRARADKRGEVAVKVFYPHLTRTPNFVSVFEKVTSALTALTHPNILPCADRGRSNGYYFLTSDWMLRGSLRDAMHAGPMPSERVVQIGLGICEALDYAHRRGLPHRNLVPENIFIDPADRVRVADFGVSMLSGRGLSDGDAKGDLHALGCILYELLAGVAPVGDPGPISRRVPGVPPRLDELLSRALAPRATERFGRATELALALRLVTASKSNGLQEPRPRGEALQISVKGRLITVTLLPDASIADFEAAVERLDEILGQGRCRLAYDLGQLSIMDDEVRSILVRLHLRHQRNIDRVAFCSPRALVRSSALVVGGSVKRVPWKSFAGPGPMTAWLEEASP